MSINTLRKLALNKNNDGTLPDWVSTKNVSLAAYECINQFKVERLKYISIHNKAKDYKKKGLYLITATEVAKFIGTATTTLICTSAYSSKLKSYLDKVNSELEVEKELKLSKHLKTLSAGMKQRKKEEISKELQLLREELTILKTKNVETQIEKILNTLSLPVKQKLGINC